MRILVVAVLAASLVGCSSDEDTYCATLERERAAFAELADAAKAKDPDYLGDALAVFERVRGDAPEELRDEWDTVVFAWSDLLEALRQSGIDPGQFDPAERPAGVSRSEFTKVRDTAGKLSSARVRDAVAGIGQHARDACDVDLSL